MGKDNMKRLRSFNDWFLPLSCYIIFYKSHWCWISFFSMYKLKVIAPFLYLKGIMSLEYIRRNGYKKIQGRLTTFGSKSQVKNQQ